MSSDRRRPFRRRRAAADIAGCAATGNLLPLLFIPLGVLVVPAVGRGEDSRPTCAARFSRRYDRRPGARCCCPPARLVTVISWLISFWPWPAFIPTLFSALPLRPGLRSRNHPRPVYGRSRPRRLSGRVDVVFSCRSGVARRDAGRGGAGAHRSSPPPKLQCTYLRSLPSGDRPDPKTVLSAVAESWPIVPGRLRRSQASPTPENCARLSPPFPAFGCIVAGATCG